MARGDRELAGRFFGFQERHDASGSDVAGSGIHFSGLHPDIFGFSDTHTWPDQ